MPLLGVEVLKMQVDMNNIRKQAVFAYNSLCKKLNDNRNDDGWGKFIRIDADEIQQDMDDLRSMIGALAFCYLPDNEEFRNLSDEIGDIEVFNIEEETVED